MDLKSVSVCHHPLPQTQKMGEKILHLTHMGGMIARGVALLPEWYLSTVTMNVLNVIDQFGIAVTDLRSNRQLFSSVL